MATTPSASLEADDLSDEYFDEDDAEGDNSTSLSLMSGGRYVDSDGPTDFDRASPLPSSHLYPSYPSYGSYDYTR